MSKPAQHTSPEDKPGKYWQLIACGDWLSGQSYVIKGHTVLGRDTSCDITIPGTHLSRRHAELAITGDKLLIRDLGSSNGTFIDQEQISESELKDGDEIRFDVLTFRVQAPGSEITTKKAQHASAQQQANSAEVKKPGSQAPTRPTRQATGPTEASNTDQKTSGGGLWFLLYLALGAAAVAAASLLLKNL